MKQKNDAVKKTAYIQPINYGSTSGVMYYPSTSKTIKVTRTEKYSKVITSCNFQ